ncbi:hypothetical protein LAZ67_3002889 [Cordylochernes scorpioides]|uniref:Tc1-like transposase DDE domain-containing protein n=1 Tax=Cordylochernes scorpioides TaxID=51811 RepID=A0ABY6K864_9ARAC|nr:hypothetical protein LAZ67_3002889 [Cordylochernes scorpioides]
MTAQRYVDDVLRPVTLPYLQGVPNALYQQDNARPHTARISQQALQDVQMLPWPPYSPDLSPIEHVWDIIGRRLHALPQPRSEDELWQMPYPAEHPKTPENQHSSGSPFHGNARFLWPPELLAPCWIQHSWMRGTWGHFASFYRIAGAAEPFNSCSGSTRGTGHDNRAMAAALQKIDMDPEKRLYTPKIENDCCNRDVWRHLRLFIGQDNNNNHIHTYTLVREDQVENFNIDDEHNPQDENDIDLSEIEEIPPDEIITPRRRGPEPGMTREMREERDLRKEIHLSSGSRRSLGWLKGRAAELEQRSLASTWVLHLAGKAVHSDPSNSMTSGQRRLLYWCEQHSEWKHLLVGSAFHIGPSHDLTSKPGIIRVPREFISWHDKRFTSVLNSAQPEVYVGPYFGSRKTVSVHIQHDERSTRVDILDRAKVHVSPYLVRLEVHDSLYLGTPRGLRGPISWHAQRSTTVHILARPEVHDSPYLGTPRGPRQSISWHAQRSTWAHILARPEVHDSPYLGTPRGPRQSISWDAQRFTTVHILARPKVYVGPYLGKPRGPRESISWHAQRSTSVHILAGPEVHVSPYLGTPRGPRQSISWQAQRSTSVHILARPEVYVGPYLGRPRGPRQSISWHAQRSTIVHIFARPEVHVSPYLGTPRVLRGSIPWHAQRSTTVHILAGPEVHDSPYLGTPREVYVGPYLGTPRGPRQSISWHAQRSTTVHILGRPEIHDSPYLGTPRGLRGSISWQAQRST